MHKQFASRTWSTRLWCIRFYSPSLSLSVVLQRNTLITDKGLRRSFGPQKLNFQKKLLTCSISANKAPAYAAKTFDRSREKCSMGTAKKYQRDYLKAQKF